MTFFFFLIKIFTNSCIDFLFLMLTHTNLVVHERFQALNKFVLVPFVNTLLPANEKKKKKHHCTI